jgi:hypothetical protein
MCRVHLFGPLSDNLLSDETAVEREVLDEQTKTARRPESKQRFSDLVKRTDDGVFAYTIVHSEEKPEKDNTSHQNAVSLGPVQISDWSVYDRLKMAISMR